MQRRLSTTIGLILANSLTMARLGMGLVFPFSLAAWRLPMVVAGVLSEFLDGQVARFMRAESTFGRLMDPVADKVFSLGVFITILLEGYITPLEAILITSRDLLIIYAMIYGFLTGQWHRIKKLRPRIAGKVATAVQMGFMVYVLWLGHAELWALILTAIASAWAAIDYYMIYRTKQV